MKTTKDSWKNTLAMCDDFAPEENIILYKFTM